MSFTAVTSIFGCKHFIPPETVAEILLNVELSSLARLSCTTSAFYHFLESPRSDLIWSHARKTFKFPVPGPPEDEGWSESSWARWIFGTRNCTSCGLPCNTVPWSFPIRIRVCKKRTCDPYRFHSHTVILLDSKGLLKVPKRYASVISWLPYHTTNKHNQPQSSYMYYSKRQLDWAVEFALRKSAELGEEGAREYFDRKAALLPAKIEHYNELKKWREEYARWRASVAKFNKNRAKAFYQHLHIRSVDIWGCRTFKETMSALTNCNEKFTDSIFDPLRKRILEEAFVIQAERTKLRQASKSCITAKKIDHPTVLKGKSYKCLHCLTSYAKRVAKSSQPQHVLVEGDPNVRGKRKNGIRNQKWRELTAAERGDKTREKQGSISRAMAVHTWDGLRSHVAVLHRVKRPRSEIDYVFAPEDGEIVERILLV